MSVISQLDCTKCGETNLFGFDEELNDEFFKKYIGEKLDIKCTKCGYHNIIELTKYKGKYDSMLKE